MASTKRIAKKEEKYQLILQVAEAIMKDKGLYSLSMDEVAHKAGLAKGTLYLYFKSKEEIFAVLALKARKLLLQAFQDAVANIDKPIEQLKAIILANHTFLLNNSLYYELVSFYEIIERETENEEMALAVKDITALVVSIIRAGQQEGTIRTTLQPEVLSMSMWGMTVGMMQLIKVKATAIHQAENLSEKELLNHYLSVFEGGISKND